MEGINIFNSQEIRVNEAFYRNSPMEPLYKEITIGESICRISCGQTLGSGFLLKTQKKNRLFYCLMTCEHVITKNFVKTKKSIIIRYDNLRKTSQIYLDGSKRFIRDYKYMNIDAIVIEILPEDGINKKYFLSPNIQYSQDYSQFKKENIYIPQFPKGGKLKNSKGKIIDINIYSSQFSHKSSTEKGSSGSPIIMLKNSSIIGIHKQGSSSKNYGNFIHPIIESLENNNEYTEINYNNGEKYEGEIKNNKREGYGKYTWQNGEYYIGQWLNNKKHGYGIKYRNNNVIKYEGKYFDDKYNGYGKYIYDNGDYYIGNFNNGIRNGDGEYYNFNKELKYCGSFYNNIIDGFGTFYYTKDEYYTGCWKNNMQNGWGQYYKHNLLFFEGIYDNGQRNGKGLEYYEKTYYNTMIKHYNCEYKFNQKNGEGKEYYKDTTLKFNGQFLNDKYKCGTLYFKNNNNYKSLDDIFDLLLDIIIPKNNNKCIRYEGNFENGLLSEGTCYYSNGDYYSGKWNKGHYEGEGEYYTKDYMVYKGNYKKSKKQGKGIEFYPNGKKKYDGYFNNDKYEGDGTFYFKNGDYFVGHWENGKRNGHGALFSKNNNLICECEFVNGYPTERFRYLFSDIKNFFEEKINN